MDTHANSLVQAVAVDAQPVSAMNRRRFMEVGVLASAAVAGATLTGIGGRFVTGKALEVEPGQWVKLEEVGTITADQVLRLSYLVTQRDAWRRVEKKGLLYVTMDENGAYRVLDATCTHLGCTVRWDEADHHFRCPCHDARFGQDGAVVSGPPPQPLRQLATKVEEGVLWAQV